MTERIIRAIRKCKPEHMRHQYHFDAIDPFFFMEGKQELTGYITCNRCGYEGIATLDYKLELIE